MSHTTNADSRPRKIDALYESVTQQIINHLKEGVPTWTRPWVVSKRNGIGIVPANAISARPYSGANILILWIARELCGYPSNGWLTYQQC
ncbi:ArdC family protein [Methylopila sp. 73B]|uniref:ArdC-like ssDNA-binding domain-containing protein n=1 Tax=Methylopila sp. 73B TaxID=1120792 RepID=UPI0009E0743D|nr:ArdC family protein [Methylopila sp. 73B]